jgi:BirA family biotin operon repressor/biotin-[acetyl-CoA-carboxylase] ligase
VSYLENHFSTADLDRICTRTFVKHVEFHQQIASTNDRALELVSEPSCPFPLLVLTELQTAGRGRGANRWWASHGALTFSVLLSAGGRAAPSCWPLVSLTAGLAVCEALEELLRHPAYLKWPNDVYVRNRKVCGILVEVPRHRQEALVVGIGINVNNSLRYATGPVEQAISLSDVADRRFPLVEVLVAVLDRLAQRYASIGQRDGELRDHWRRRCLLTGRTVHLQLAARSLVGICQGIDHEGALLVHTGVGLERCFAGVVTQFD